MQTVLVIDDDTALRDTIGLMLEKEGFRPALAADGKSGLKQALSPKPDLILVELKMPGLRGMDVCKQVRSAEMKTPMIVLSANGDDMDKALLFEIGGDDYWDKPFGMRRQGRTGDGGAGTGGAGGGRECAQAARRGLGERLRGRRSGERRRSCRRRGRLR